MPRETHHTRLSIPDKPAQDRPQLTVRGKEVSSGTRPAVDLVFVIDTTGSMSDKIEGVLATTDRFLNSFSQLGLDHRVAIVAFGDLTMPGEHVVSTPFMTQLEAVRKTLAKIPRFGGGGNEGESSLEAVEAARKMPFRPTSVKVLVLITDEPALQHQLDARSVTDRLRRDEILTYVISPPIEYFKEMAQQTGGAWLQVTAAADFDTLLGMLRQLAERMSSLVQEVHQLASGSVRKYLRIKSSPRAD